MTIGCGCMAAGLILAASKAEAAVSYAPLTLTENGSSDPFPSDPGSSGFFHTFPGTPDTFDFTFEGPYLTSYPPVDGLQPTTPIPVDVNWHGMGTLSFSRDSGDGGSSHTAYPRVTGIDDFGPPVPGAEFPGRENVSGELYFIYGTQRFNFRGDGTAPTTWTLEFDFTTLANGFLPAGTLLAFTDIDGVNTDGEMLTITAALESGTNDPFLAFLDRNDNEGEFMDEAVHNPLSNSYTFDDADPPGADNDSVAYLTTENIDTLTIVANQGNVGGAYGFKIAAPSGPIPIPEPATAFLVSMSFLIVARRRR